MSIFTVEEEARWQQGTCTRAYKKLGAHPCQGGILFRVWAPHAKAVHVAGDFNSWADESHPMWKEASTGIWQTTIEEASAGDYYKFRITPARGEPFFKADPYGFNAENDSFHASIIYPLPAFEWDDDYWMKQRGVRHQYDKPLSIYEMHFGSWRHKASGALFKYSEMADELIPYVKKMGFTHIELMPIMEYPYGPSWGYQVAGHYAPTSRYGLPHDFMAFINTCHQHDIGVILDWVPGHFPKDEHSLAYFDGTPLYEHADPRRREQPDWGTHNVDFEKPGVRNYFLSNAFFWCDIYHIDGLRVDAVSAMLYLDYAKKEGEWLPNQFGGKKNLGAVAFLQSLNSRLQQQYPAVLKIAEESTAWAGVTKPVHEDGLAFDYKWNLGWMNDTLHYFELSSQEKTKASTDITFSLNYAFNEHFVLPLSHDEVVHMKHSLWSKMPGSSEQKFAQLKLLYLYMMGWPGKKLLFMGSELAEQQEWAENRPLNWQLLQQEEPKRVQQFLARLLRYYRSEKAFHSFDSSFEGFEWLDLSQKEQGIFAFKRKALEETDDLVFIFNFLNQSYENYEPANISGEVFWLLEDTLQPDNTGQKVTFPVHLEPFQGLLMSPKRERGI